MLVCYFCDFCLYNCVLFEPLSAVLKVKVIIICYWNGETNRIFFGISQYNLINKTIKPIYWLLNLITTKCL